MVFYHDLQDSLWGRGGGGGGGRKNVFKTSGEASKT